MNMRTIALCLATTLLLVGCGNGTESKEPTSDEGSVISNEVVSSDSGSPSLEEYNKVVAERDYYKEQYEKLTESIEDSNVETSVDSEFMEACRNTKSISLWLGVNTESISGKIGVYTLSLKDDHSQFQYLNKNMDPFEGFCDFSSEKFYELRDLLCSTELEKYAPQADENGKLLYEDVDSMITISLGPSDGSVFVADPSNKAEIEAFFEDLVKSATE